MITPKRFSLAALCFIRLALGCAVPAQAAGTVYYVSSSGGQDSNPGLSESQPLATVAKVNSLNLRPGDQVLFKCGDTWRGEMLTVSKSGAAGQPITFGTYPAGCANQPVLSGAQPVAGWSLSGKNIYVADLSAGANAGKFGYGVNQLFRGDQRLTLGRWPNLDTGDGYATITAAPAANQITSAQLPAGNWAGAVAHIKGMRWYILNRQVTGSSGTTLTLGADNDCWGACTGWGFFLNNSLNTLDQEGEWYYDSATQKLYLYTTTGAPADGAIEGSVILKNDSRFWGGITLGQDLTGQGPAYLTVDNLAVRRWFRDGIALPTNFAHTEPHDLTVQNNTIQDVDGTGLRLATWVYSATDGRPDGWRGGYALTVANNLIERANRMGIDLYSRNSTFTNNTVRDVGQVANLGAAGLGCAYTDGGGSCTEDGDGLRVKIDQPNDSGNTNTFSGNRLERIGFSGVEVFGYSNTFTHNVVIQACLTKGDCGAMGSFGRDSLASSAVHDLTFTENILVDTLGNTDGCRSDFRDLFGFGFYIDNYSRNITLTGNTVVSSTVHGILFQNSTGTITGNTLYNNGRTYPYGGAQVAVGDAPAYVATHTGNTLFSLSNTSARTLSLSNLGRLGTSNTNYFFSPYQPKHIAVNGDKALAAWQAYSGQDAGSSEQWYTQAAGQAPKSHLFYNDTARSQTIDLGAKLYKDLAQASVSGSFSLAPYQSRILIESSDAADLAVSLALAGSADSAPGAPLTYTLQVWNQGRLAASAVTLVNTLPAEIVNTRWQAQPTGAVLQAGTQYTWQIASLPVNGVYTFTVSGQYAATVTVGQPLRITAQATTTSPEASPGNNLAQLLLGAWKQIYLPVLTR